MAAVPEFDGKTAIVTGGARGLGRAITRMLVDRGATVAIIDLDEKTAAETTRDLKRHNGKIHHVTGDIRFREGARAAVAETARQLGRLDILVNNAGVYPRKPLLEIDDEAWNHTFDVNLRGMYHVTAAAVPLQLRDLGILADLEKNAPLGRVAEPDDIAEVVCFLASDRNRFITGETIIASGGIIMA